MGASDRHSEQNARRLRPRRLGRLSFSAPRLRFHRRKAAASREKRPGFSTRMISVSPAIAWSCAASRSLIASSPGASGTASPRREFPKSIIHTGDLRLIDAPAPIRARDAAVHEDHGRRVRAHLLGKVRLEKAIAAGHGDRRLAHASERLFAQGSFDGVANEERSRENHGAQSRADDDAQVGPSSKSARC